ncbi:MAG TPA: hypothetical protein VIL39_04740 [Verrucomicrobiae bacterium]
MILRVALEALIETPLMRRTPVQTDLDERLPNQARAPEKQQGGACSDA